MKTTGETVSGRTAEERLAECESAMAQEEETAERGAETDKIRSRTHRALLGLERRREKEDA